ncbi:unnamed protein product [Ceutorhynchus assimilis]|uniref:Peptidase S1 domain-containing protein n=1 Tax=Ceutorhynchus assimilis TaxID=467358 RepID=A0A9N9MQD3_9CUCU|nr:unnamed protein product [Ceutorhynchus assimilis]
MKLGTIGLSLIFAVIVNKALNFYSELVSIFLVVTTKPQHPPFRIVKGTDAEDGEFPYMVQLIDDVYNIYFCGGSIIGEMGFETAGHCVKGFVGDTEYSRKIRDYIGEDMFNSTHNLCSDNYWNGECLGDSGSPFVINGLQYDVVSWSFNPCGIQELTVV